MSLSPAEYYASILCARPMPCSNEDLLRRLYNNHVERQVTRLTNLLRDPVAQDDDDQELILDEIARLQGTLMPLQPEDE